MTDQVSTTTQDWKSLVEESDPDLHADIIVYEFGEGARKFTEPFDPEGRGIYE